MQAPRHRRAVVLLVLLLAVFETSTAFLHSLPPTKLRDVLAEGSRAAHTRLPLPFPAAATAAAPFTRPTYSASLTAAKASLSDAELLRRARDNANNNPKNKYKKNTNAPPSTSASTGQGQQDGAANPVGLVDIVSNLHERTWASLDLHVVQEHLASLCDTVRAKDLARSSCFAEDVHEVHRRYKAVEEVWQSVEPIPLNDPMDIAPAVNFASRGNTLELPDLRSIAKALILLATLRDFMQAPQRAERVPQLAAYSEGIDIPYELVELLTDAFDKDGRLSGDKFPQLKRLRDEVDRLYGSIRNTVGQLMKSTGMSNMITDEYIAQRNGRFVLPIKNTYKRSGLGIVHDQSNTGQTVYVEPVQVIEPTNDMKRLELELLQEEARIVGEMTRLIAISKDRILGSLDAAALVDISVARAKLGDVLGGAVVPEVGTEGCISAEDARHPVLVLRGRNPVGNNIHIEKDKPGLVLTGPNAGGKTIVLKTLGLLALLVRLGIPVPAQRGVRVDFFSPILADIGDMQSVTGDLSTFSGHLLVCKEVLSKAASGALVLMDEMGSGTDPAQGVAIAQALLEALLETGARVAITTHYVQLKELAQKDDRFVVGAMEFLDGKPTYRFKEGAVGESYALEVAERLELPSAVLERARGLMDKGVVKVTELIKELENQRDALAGERREAEAREQEMRKMQAEMEKKQRQLEAREVEVEKMKYRAKLQAADTFLAQLQEKEKKLEGLLKGVGLGDEKATVEEALRELAAVRGQVAVDSKPEMVHVPSNIVLFKRDDIVREGEVVVCAGDQLNSDRAGKVVKASGQNVDVMFSKGGLDIVITFKKTDLARAPSETAALVNAGPYAGLAKNKEKKKKWTKADERNLKMLGKEMNTVSSATAVTLNAMRTSFNTIDVRGLRLRDAESKVDNFIKVGIPQKRKVVYILHGHGTGQLKEGLREFMKRHPYVGRHRSADESDGGDAFTQVFLK